MKFFKKKQINATIKEITDKEFETVVDTIKKPYVGLVYIWNDFEKIDFMMKLYLEYGSVHYLVNAMIVKLQEELKTANPAERLVIYDKIKTIEKFVSEYERNIFELNNYYEYDRNYEKTRSVFEKQAKKFLSEELKSAIKKGKQEQKAFEEKYKKEYKAEKLKQKELKERRSKLAGQIQDL